MSFGYTKQRAGRLVVAASLLAILVLSACSAGASGANGSVSFVDLKDGAAVSSPLLVKIAADNFTVEPAGEVKAGHGHLHITIDGDCIAAGQVVPKDDTHLHYGQGQVEATLELAPGAHTLCLQAADGAHIALPGDSLTQKINITVQ